MRPPTRPTRRDDAHPPCRRHPEELRVGAASRRMRLHAWNHPSRLAVGGASAPPELAPQDDDFRVAIAAELFAMTMSQRDDVSTMFVRRHIGPSPRDVAAMLESVG